LIDIEAFKVGIPKEKASSRSNSLGSGYFNGVEDSANESNGKKHECGTPNL
jgi:hypothetical protein